jgi:hypothetical protein
VATLLLAVVTAGTTLLALVSSWIADGEPWHETDSDKQNLTTLARGITVTALLLGFVTIFFFVRWVLIRQPRSDRRP